MRTDTYLAGAAVVAALLQTGAASAQASGKPGTEEFGLTPRELVQYVERVEGLISKCMRSQGFQYIAADYETVRAGMAADKRLPGLDEGQFIDKYGYGVATTYTGKPPQLATGYSPAKVGLGERNAQIFASLSPADRVAYNRALLGENFDATFAVGLETENFARTGGCTRQAIDQVFKPEQVSSKYYNPLDSLIRRHPRMKAAIRYYAIEMKKAGFDYNHPDEVEPDIRQRLNALTDGGRIAVEQLSPAQQGALRKLQDFERRVAKINFKLQTELLDPVEEKIQRELYARKVQ